MDVISSSMRGVRHGINDLFVGKEPWQIATITTSAVLLSVWFYEFLFQDEPLRERAIKTFFKYAKKIPRVRREIDRQLAEVRTSLEQDVINRTETINYLVKLPQKGLSNNEILKLVEAYTNITEYDWKRGKVSGAVYYLDEKLLELLGDVYKKTSYTNPLHPDIFPGLCKMEAEVVQMALKLFHGDSEACGTMTSGGTESILMACKTYRDFGKEELGIKKPEMVLPTTAHTAFEKAAKYFKIRLRYIPIDPVTTKVDLQLMERAINKNTVMLVGSAPNFPYGTMDEISKISELGEIYGVPVHVDSCLGGFLTAFMEDAGFPTPICDFRLPGVTSISADTHKYGFCPKGTSVILYSKKIFRHYQYVICSDWPGGIYGSPTVNGSRAGGAIGTCWATLMYFGAQGYIEATREIIHTTRYIEKGLRDIKELYIFGQPATSVIAIGSQIFDVYRLSEKLIALGWNLNILQFPNGIHLCVTYMHTQPGIADKFLEDVRNSVSEILKNPNVPPTGRVALYGAAQSIPDRTIVEDFTRYFLDSLYYTPQEEQD